ncbi:MAG: hypothetical protein WB902_22615 [Acetobacteraceae bacterium]
MMAIISSARVRFDKRRRRKFGIATDGMRMAELAIIALAYAIATSLAL